MSRCLREVLLDEISVVLGSENTLETILLGCSDAHSVKRRVVKYGVKVCMCNTEISGGGGENAEVCLSYVFFVCQVVGKSWAMKSNF